MASNPSVLSINEWEWVKVATGVTSGVIHRLSSVVCYYQTYRLTGESEPPAPTVGSLPEEAVRMFEDSNSEGIESAEAIDIYVLCCNSDSDSSETGKVRIDL